MLAAAAGKGQTIWGSNPGNWYDFDKSGKRMTDGLDVTLTDHGEIMWMSGHKQLVVGTTQGIYYVARTAWASAMAGHCSPRATSASIARAGTATARCSPSSPMI